MRQELARDNIRRETNQVFEIQKRAFRAETKVSRRHVLSGTVAGVTAAATAGSSLMSTASAAAPHPATYLPPDGQVVSEQFGYSDPLDKMRAEFRIYRDWRDEADVLLWYMFTIFIVAEGHPVAPLVRYEGIEFSHHKRIGENTFRIHGHNMSFPRAMETGAFTETATNPINGKQVEVPPTVLTEDPGMLYSPAGKRPLDRTSAEFTPTSSLFRIEDEMVKVEQIRVPPDAWFTPFIESSHNWTPRAMFDDESILRLPMGTSGGYVFPYPEWLDMGDIKGHMFGIWSGKKLNGPEQLPAEYLARAEADYPELLEVDQTPFKT
jgi:hypothetical protein